MKYPKYPFHLYDIFFQIDFFRFVLSDDTNHNDLFQSMLFLLMLVVYEYMLEGLLVLVLIQRSIQLHQYLPQYTLNILYYVQDYFVIGADILILNRNLANLVTN